MEYKFRGKRKDNGEWVVGCLVSTTPDEAFILIGVTGHIKRDDYECYMIEVIPETVGMWTGLTLDKLTKSKKDIYEGDIVKDYSYRYLVEWDSRSAMFVLLFIYDNEVDDELTGGFRQSSKAMPVDGFLLELIGNRTDNPELLKPAQRRAY